MHKRHNKHDLNKMRDLSFSVAVEFYCVNGHHNVLRGAIKERDVIYLTYPADENFSTAYEPHTGSLLPAIRFEQISAYKNDTGLWDIIQECGTYTSTEHGTEFQPMPNTKNIQNLTESQLISLLEPAQIKYNWYVDFNKRRLHRPPYEKDAFAVPTHPLEQTF